MSEKEQSNSDQLQPPHSSLQGIASETDSVKSNTTMMTEHQINQNVNPKTGSPEETKETTEDSPLITQIINLAEYIAKQINEKFEPYDALQEIIRFFDNQFSEIWEILRQNKALKVTFYKQVFKNVVDKMLNEKIINSVEVSQISYNIGFIQYLH